MLEDLRDVCLRLQEETDKKDRAVLYAAVNEMIQTVVRYTFRRTGEKLRKGAEDAVGGKVLELQTLKNFGKEGKKQRKKEKQKEKQEQV